MPQRYLRAALRYGPRAVYWTRRFWRGYRKSYMSRLKGRRGRPMLRGGNRSYIAKRQKFSTSQIGQRIGTSNSKSTLLTTGNWALRDTRTLYQINLCQIPFGQDIDERERNMVNYRGCRICFAVRSETTLPLYFHMAIVAPKQTQTVVNADFFKGDGAERGRTFDTTLSAVQFHCSRINTDRYTVLKHKKYLLNPTNNTSSYGADSGKSYRYFDFYTKIKRQLRYESNADAVPIDGNIYFVYWADRFTADSGQAIQADSYSRQEQISVFFRDVKP